MKYRTDHRDSIPPPPVKRKHIHRTGIDPPDGRLGVFKDGQRFGHVGPHAGAGVAARLIGGGSVHVGRVAGKDAWIADNIVGGVGSAQTSRAKAKLAAQLRTDRGSAKK